MFDILRDIRDAFRSVRRQPSVTLVIVLTLAVGIGAVAAIFTYFVELYWYRLDAPDAERMYHVYTGTAEKPESATSYPDAQLYREALAGLGEIATRGLFFVTLTVPEEGNRPSEKFVRVCSQTPRAFYIEAQGKRSATLGRDATTSPTLKGLYRHASIPC